MKIPPLFLLPLLALFLGACQSPPPEERAGDFRATGGIDPARELIVSMDLDTSFAPRPGDLLSRPDAEYLFSQAVESLFEERGYTGPYRVTSGGGTAIRTGEQGMIVRIVRWGRDLPDSVEAILTVSLKQDGVVLPLGTYRGTGVGAYTAAGPDALRSVYREAVYKALEEAWPDWQPYVKAAD